MKVIGIDPALANTGWAVVVDGKYTESGTIKTPPEIPIQERLAKIDRCLTAAIAGQGAVDEIHIETPIVATVPGRGTGTMYAHIAYGAVLAILNRIRLAPQSGTLGAVLYRVSNSSWKAWLKLGKAQKSDTRKIITAITGKKLNEHESDATAIALYRPPPTVPE